MVSRAELDIGQNRMETGALEAGLARFGFESFRPGQREAVETLLEQKKLLLA